MVARKPNLLEAFRAAAPESRDAQKRSSPPPVAPGGPFAAPKVAAERETTRLQFFDPPRKPFLERVFGDRVVQLVLVLAVVAVGAAFLFKRGPSEAGSPSGTSSSADIVQAAGADAATSSNPALIPVSGAGASSPAAAPARATPPSSASEHDKAFYDVANKYTVRVAQYNNDDAGLKRARAAVAYLMKEGYPAVQPIRSGDGSDSALIVCVGAAAKAKDIEVLQKDLKQLRGPQAELKKLPFGDAYIVRIDDVLRRQ